MPGGVTAAQMALTHLVEVRILAWQREGNSRWKAGLVGEASADGVISNTALCISGSSNGRTVGFDPTNRSSNL